MRAMIQKKFTKAIHITIVALLSFILTMGIWLLTHENLGLAGNEFFLYQKNPSESSDKIVIVQVDNKSLDALQKTDLRVLNLSKKVFADLIEKLDDAGAKAIGLDIVFANMADDASILAESLEKHPNVVI